MRQNHFTASKTTNAKVHQQQCQRIHLCLWQQITYGFCILLLLLLVDVMRFQEQVQEYFVGRTLNQLYKSIERTVLSSYSTFIAVLMDHIRYKSNQSTPAQVMLQLQDAIKMH